MFVRKVKKKKKLTAKAMLEIERRRKSERRRFLISMANSVELSLCLNIQIYSEEFEGHVAI